MTDEAGQVGGIEGLAFGFLVFVLGTLVVVNCWGVIDARAAAGSAAREGTRAFVESEATSTEAALAEAEAAASAAIAGYGRDPERMAFVPEAARLVRCAPVAIRVEYRVPLLTVPLLGRYGDGFVAVGRHREVVDPFRGGIPDRGACPEELRR